MPDFYEFYINIIGLQNARITGSQISSLCPIKEHSKKNRCFSANIDTGQCKCHKGCFSGNAYLLAERLNIDNPSQWLTNNEHKPMEYKLVKTKNINTEVKKTETKFTQNQLTEFAAQYTKNINKDDLHIQSIPDSYHDLFGLTDDGILTFHYFVDGKCIGIKRHKDKNGKCRWIGDGSCKIFKQQFIQDFGDTIYIVEGERDAIYAPFNSISFSSGAGSIPKDLSQIYVRNNIFIIYDNDEAGRDGADKLAQRIKMEKPEINVKIAQWGNNIPDGYDIYEDYLRTQTIDKYDYNRLNDAIDNAIDFELTLPNKIGSFTIMTGKEASLKEAKPTEWLIENVLPKEFNSCLAGTTGAKKSMWAIQLGMALANGDKEFCGNKINAPGIKVLYVDTEIGKDELHRRYKKIQQNMNWVGDDNFIMMSKGGYHIDIWNDVHEVIKYTNPKLVVFDSLYNTTTVGDFSKSAQMSKVIDELTKFKEQYSVTILTIAHFNKGQHDLGLSIDRMQGSSVLQNWVEFQSLMVSTNKNDFNLWTVAKARGVRHDQSIIGLKWNDFWFKTIGAVEDIKPFLIPDEKKQKWQKVLEDCPKKFDTNQWLNVFNTKFPMSERTGRQWLKECSESPMVKKVTHGLYEKNLRLITEDNIDDE